MPLLLTFSQFISEGFLLPDYGRYRPQQQARRMPKAKPTVKKTRMPHPLVSFAKAVTKKPATPKPVKVAKPKVVPTDKVLRGIGVPQQKNPAKTPKVPQANSNPKSKKGMYPY